MPLQIIEREIDVIRIPGPLSQEDVRSVQVMTCELFLLLGALTLRIGLGPFLFGDSLLRLRLFQCRLRSLLFFAKLNSEDRADTQGNHRREGYQR